jgi:raffinose/stachyose/melibiose transport system permease protein
MAASRLSLAAARFRPRTFAVRLGATLLLAAIGLVAFYPVALLIFTATKSPAEMARNTFGPPATLYLKHLIKVWQSDNLGLYLRNSLVVSAGVVLGTVALAALGGFGFARLKFSGQAVFLGLIVLGLVVPFETLVIPIFYMLRSLRLLSTYWAMILPQVALGLPFGILLVRSFVMGLPQELFDAAELDGCSAWQRFWYVALPLIRPALVAVGIFQAIWSWNQYLLPLVVVQDPDMRTVPVMLGYFIGKHGADFGRLTAAALMLFIPPLIAYLIFHRRVLNARLTGAFSSY